MVKEKSWGRQMFTIANYLFLSLFSLACLLPILHVFAVSLSSNTAAMAGIVKFWPVDFSLIAYTFALGKPLFIGSILVSLKRVVLGTVINMTLTLLIAYPLSKENSSFRWRTAYAWFFAFTMFFGGGLIPNYLVVQHLGLIDTIWALVLPGAVQVFSVVLMLNFFRVLPREIEESAYMDGAGHFTILTRIFIPASLPAMATLTLFAVVFHWNSWFDGIIYMNSPENYPLQSYLKTIIVKLDPSFMSTDDVELMKSLSEETLKSAQIFLGAIPVLIIYPFLQRYFVKGIVLGSVKG